MKISSPALKMLILDLIAFEDKVDEKGARAIRNFFPKTFLKGAVEAKTKIQETMDLAFKDGEEIKWVPFKSEWPTNRPVGERQTGAEVDLSEAAIKAIKHFYDEREDLPEVPVETLEALEDLISHKTA